MPPDQPTSQGHAPLAEAALRLRFEEPRWREAAAAFPVRWPREYLELAASDEGAPVRRMGIPAPAELLPDAADLANPVGEALVSPIPFVVQKHGDRALLVVTARCHFYCRFCFRRAFPGGEHRDPTRAEMAAALESLASQQGLREVILSGGDPLVLSDERLAEILEGVAGLPSAPNVRVHTRAPVHFPERVTPALARLLGTARGCRVVTHFNHAVELRGASLAAVGALQAAGIPVLNQAVLLAGVNDSVEALTALALGLARAGVRPYYLHHPDRVPGTAHFRVSIERGLELHAGLARQVAAEFLPEHVIDPPDGSGKIPVASLVRGDDGAWRTPAGCVVQEATGLAGGSSAKLPSPLSAERLSS